MIQETYSIYALICPLDSKIKYVGLSKDLQKRYYTHCCKPGKPTLEWITKLKEVGKYPIMKELEKFTDARAARYAEFRWMAKIQEEQGGLLNAKGVAVLPKYPEIQYLPIQDKEIIQKSK